MLHPQDILFDLIAIRHYTTFEIGRCTCLSGELTGNIATRTALRHRQREATLQKGPMHQFSQRLTVFADNVLASEVVESIKWKVKSG